MTTWRIVSLVLVIVFAAELEGRADEQITDWKGTAVRLREGDVMSGGVKIHYHTAGDGPLLILIHGIGGFWFDWRHQLPTLATKYTVVAMTQRGFDKSDQPVGVEHYAAAKIAGDIDALITHFGRDKATIMAYDSGGFHGWYFAMHHPERTERFVAIGSFHPATLVREYATNPVQQTAGEYSRNFQTQPDAAATMAKRMTDPNAPPRPGETPDLHRMRLDAAKRSSFDAMMNFYKANWPRAPYSLDMPAIGGRISDYPKVNVPTLVVYGREDVPLVVNGLNDLWKWVDQELTLLVVPGAGHGPHVEAPEFVTPRIMDWLATRAHPSLVYPRPR
ncbi:MAG: alpha/beta hydrolase [Acidimicrobiia bacterium]|nr:alpha/beta hydrolase [Acidimicrobiia bacterium]